MKKVKGYWGGRSKLLRTAKESYFRALQYAYNGRKKKKGDFRRLWIIRINAAVRAQGLNYSQFINALAKAEITINRKAMSEMAINDPQSFAQLVEIAKKQISQQEKK